jgi:hypothetical protein
MVRPPGWRIRDRNSRVRLMTARKLISSSGNKRHHQYQRACSRASILAASKAARTRPAAFGMPDPLHPPPAVWQWPGQAHQVLGPRKPSCASTLRRGLSAVRHSLSERVQWEFLF